MTTPEQFLKNLGIELKTTALFSVIDGCVRQPDLCVLLRDYAALKTEEQNPPKSLKACCPKCKSENLYQENGMGGTHCEDCKHFW